MTRARRAWLLGAAAALLMAAAFVWLGGGDTGAAAQPAAAPAAPRPSLAVTVARPQTAELAMTLAANGSMAAWQEALVGSESGGLTLAEVHVNIGDVVTKGQVLAVFAPETVQADIAQSRAALAESRATAADAAGNAARADALKATGALSLQQINQFQTAADTARARVEAAEAVLAAQQIRGRNTRLLAPDHGVISARTATVGSVTAAGTELFRLIRQGRLEWRAEVTDAEVGRVAIGMPVVLTGTSGSALRGRVRSIAPTVDPQTRLALVYVDVPGALAPGGLKAGMFARGEFQLGRSQALTVPAASVVPRDGFNQVLLLQPDGRVRKHRVETGRRAADRVELLTPLPADAQVVVRGAGLLSDGDVVRVVDGAAAAPPPASAPASSGDPNRPPVPRP